MSDFTDMIAKLKGLLSYVTEGELFTWDRVVAILIIKLTNTDSLNKTQPGVSHATQIQLTDMGSPPDGFNLYHSIYLFTRWGGVGSIYINIFSIYIGVLSLCA